MLSDLLGEGRWEQLQHTPPHTGCEQFSSLQMTLSDLELVRSTLAHHSLIVFSSGTSHLPWLSLHLWCPFTEHLRLSGGAAVDCSIVVTNFHQEEKKNIILNMERQVICLHKLVRSYKVKFIGLEKLYQIF